MIDNKLSGDSRKPSYRIQPKDAPIIKKRIATGDFLNRITADYDVNLGQIAEIMKGYKFAEIPAAHCAYNGEAQRKLRLFPLQQQQRPIRHYQPQHPPIPDAYQHQTAAP